MSNRNYTQEGAEYCKEHHCTKKEAARYIIEKYHLDADVENVRKNISKYLTNENNITQGLIAECEENGIDPEKVDYFWHKSKRFSLHVTNKEDTVNILDTIKDIVANYKPVFVKNVKLKKEEQTVLKALKATITDSHVGLDPDKKGTSLFKYKYNAEIFNANIDHVIASIQKEHQTHGRFEVLFIDCLGDHMDGWNGETTRGGHKLDQNLGNAEQFRVFTVGFLRLVETVIGMNIADKVVVRAVTDCNHSGTFGEIAFMAIKAILDRVYGSEVFEFHILTRFMEHFYYGDHCHILTHGKDQESMKHGLPKELNDKTINYINSYIDHYEIRSKYIHLEKGDLHTVNFNRTKKFDYRNFMSFAPPSTWVQKNFGDTYSGYSIQVVPKHSGEVSHSDYIFEFEKDIH